MRFGRRFAISCVAVACAWVFMVAGVATQTPGDPGTGIAATAHDFTDDTAGVGLCTFCHTPHNAIQTGLLWNHTLSSNTFSWDVLTTTGGTDYATNIDSWAGPSKLCLSCHDGSVAIGDVAWFNKASRTGVDALNTDTHDGDEYQIGTATGNLAGNHPVAHPFPFGNVANTYNGATTGAAAVVSGWQTAPETLGIRLFNDVAGVSAGSAPGQTGIECSSCHDPHNTSGAVVDEYFLRGTLDGNDTAYICLKCHNK